MASSKIAADFNAIINADRQRRKNEALAQEIFSKGRRSSAPGAGMINRKPGTGPSLASRVGVTKRPLPTSSKPSQKPIRPTAGNVDAEWTHDLHTLNNPAASRTSHLASRAPKNSHTARNDRLYSALNGTASSEALNSQFNIVGGAKPPTGLSIRGLAGPYIVIAKNFADGTTAEDIESAMTPVGGVALSCRLIAERPNVIAEIIFETKEGAEGVVNTFNNQNADGHLLHVYHKTGKASSVPKPLNSQPAGAPASHSATPLGLRADLATGRADEPRSNARRTVSERYAAAREPSRDQRRNYDRDEVMDGSYGFEDHMETDDRDGNQYDNARGKGLYSDNLVANRSSRGNGNSWHRGRGDGRGRYHR